MAGDVTKAVTQNAQQHLRSWQILIPIGCLYIGFGVMAALLQGGLPPIFRAQGMPIEKLAWLFALYLPIGLSFLWAPLVDRWKPPLLTQRIGWIVLAQAVAISGITAVARQEHAHHSMLFAWGLLVAMAVATMDLALDALAVELTPKDIKPWASAVKLGALAIGSMVGGGLFVNLLNHIGWQSTFLWVALLLLLSTLPVFTLLHYEQHLYAQQLVQVQHWFACLRQTHIRRYLILLSVLAAIIFPLSALNRVMLVDLGVSTDEIGWLLGTLQPLGLLAIAAVSAPLMQHVGYRSTLQIMAVVGVLCVALMCWGYVERTTWPAIVGTVGMSTVVGGFMVVFAALILQWSEGPQAATNYAVLFCSTRLAGMLATVFASKLVAQLSWPVYYGVGGIALAAASMWFIHTLRAPSTSIPNT